MDVTQWGRFASSEEVLKLAQEQGRAAARGPFSFLDGSDVETVIVQTFTEDQGKLMFSYRIFKHGLLHQGIDRVPWDLFKKPIYSFGTFIDMNGRFRHFADVRATGGSHISEGSGSQKKDWTEFVDPRYVHKSVLFLSDEEKRNPASRICASPL